MKKENLPNWHFAATSEINQKILDEVEPGVRSRMLKNVTADLSKVDKGEILSYF